MLTIRYSVLAEPLLKTGRVGIRCLLLAARLSRAHGPLEVCSRRAGYSLACGCEEMRQQ